jgi:hypothetical protein
VKVHVGVAGKPTIGLRLAGVEVVEDVMDLSIRMLGHKAVHEIEEPDAPAAPVMIGPNLAGRDIEYDEQGRGAVPLVVVRLAGERAPVGKLETALRPFRGLDRRLLVHCQHQRAFPCGTRPKKRKIRRIEVQANDLGSLGREGWIVALALGLAGRKVDLLRAQEAPNILHVDRCCRNRN